MMWHFSEYEVGTLFGIFPGGSRGDTSSSGGLDGTFSLACDSTRLGLFPINESDDEEPMLERGV